MLIIGGHSAQEGGCVLSFECVLGICHSSRCHNVFSKWGLLQHSQCTQTLRLRWKATHAGTVGDDVVFYEKPCNSIKSRANGWSKITRQLLDIIDGQDLLGRDQMLLNQKHLVDIFLSLPQCAEMQCMGGPDTAQGNAITLTAGSQLHFPALLCMYSLSAAHAGTAACLHKISYSVCEVTP